MLRMISSAILDRRRWQRQEVCLIVSEDILQSAFVDSLTAMGLSSWKGFAQSDSLHMLLCAARECSCSSFLHPMFEIRRMHGSLTMFDMDFPPTRGRIELQWSAGLRPVSLQPAVELTFFGGLGH